MHQYLLPHPVFLFFRSRQKFSTFVLYRSANRNTFGSSSGCSTPRTLRLRNRRSMLPRQALQVTLHLPSFTPSHFRPRRFTMLQCRETRWATPSRLVLLFIAASSTIGFLIGLVFFHQKTGDIVLVLWYEDTSGPALNIVMKLQAIFTRMIACAATSQDVQGEMARCCQRFCTIRTRMHLCHILLYIRAIGIWYMYTLVDIHITFTSKSLYTKDLILICPHGLQGHCVVGLCCLLCCNQQRPWTDYCAVGTGKREVGIFE